MNIVYAASWGGEGGVFVTKEARDTYIDRMFAAGAGCSYQTTEINVNDFPQDIYLFSPFSEWINDADIVLTIDVESAHVVKEYHTSCDDIEAYIERYTLVDGKYKFVNGI